MGLVHRMANRFRSLFLSSQARTNLAGNDVRCQPRGFFTFVLTSHAIGNEKNVTVWIDDEAILVVRAFALSSVAAHTNNKFRHAQTAPSKEVGAKTNGFYNISAGNASDADQL